MFIVPSAYGVEIRGVSTVPYDHVYTYDVLLLPIAAPTSPAGC
jgi:hypothetical protein